MDKTKRQSTIELFKEQMKFSAGHFTIFSATEREALHGHNYTVYLALETLIDDKGLSFDYRYYKQKAYDLCKQLSHTFLIPQQSEFLRIEDADQYYHIHFNNELIPFLKKDVTLMPLNNITIEELSQWFVKQFSADLNILKKHHIQQITVKVFSGPGQCSSATWKES